MRCLVLVIVLATHVLQVRSTCCKKCSKGQACGDACIAPGLTCTKTQGCACAGSCCKVCKTGQPCGDSCIARGKICTKLHGCACAGDGANQPEANFVRPEAAQRRHKSNGGNHTPSPSPRKNEASYQKPNGANRLEPNFNGGNHTPSPLPRKNEDSYQKSNVANRLEASFARPEEAQGRPQSNGEDHSPSRSPDLGCRCKGKDKDKHGHCGYHFGTIWDSAGAEPEPWCRTESGCGERGAFGSWMKCDARGVERRHASNGELYTALEFQEAFGEGSAGAAEWKAAAPFNEKRVNAKDGKAYDVYDFRSLYIDSCGEQGWLDYWSQALPEKRKALDGKDYTLKEYAAKYGEDEWENMWKDSKTDG